MILKTFYAICTENYYFIFHVGSKISCGNDGSEVGVVTAMVMGDDNGGVMVINGYYGCVINCTNK